MRKFNIFEDLEKHYIGLIPKSLNAATEPNSLDCESSFSRDLKLQQDRIVRA